jgi:uncharacterized protein with PQ loop repeat
MLTVISTLTVIVSLAAKLVGFPDQIRLIIRHRRTENISVPLNLLGAVSYGLWTLHGFLRDDWFTVAGQSLGVLFSMILVVLTLKYRGKTTGNV